MERTTSRERLKVLTCPSCTRSVILEPTARQGDVLLCPTCRATLKIARIGSTLRLDLWHESSLEAT